MTTTLPNITVTLKCQDCGYVQEVRSACAHEDSEGKPHYYFGSRYDFCDECDGPVEVEES